MNHYGIWIYKAGWMLLASGQIFWTTSRPVAEAQLESSSIEEGEGEVRAFDSTTGKTADSIRKIFVDKRP